MSKEKEYRELFLIPQRAVAELPGEPTSLGIGPQAVAKLESLPKWQPTVAKFDLDATIQMQHTIINNTRQASQRCSNWRVTHFPGVG